MAAVFSLDSSGNVIVGAWEGTTVAVSYGGTGITTTTAYGVICGGTTSTGGFQNAGAGNTGQVLTSNGVSGLPTWQTPTTGTITSVSGTSGQIDVANPTTTPVISIDPAYIGQTSITTLGTISTGTWHGSVIPLAYGGTNANLTASNGGIFYSTASAGAILAGTATANQVLLSGSSTTPAWSTATYPATTTINQLLYSSSANVIAGLTTANNGVLITSSGGIPSISSTLPTAVQTNITELGTITVGTWNGSTVSVGYGGTGNTTFTAYSVICAGTTATGAFQNVSGLGTSGQVLTSAGAGALPTWTTVSGTGTVTNVSGTSNEITVTNPTTTPTISIAATYAGQTSITTLGTIGTGTWQGSAVGVSYGGTGIGTTTAYGVICGGTTATGAFQNAGAGTSGQVLVSNGSSSLPTWQSISGSGTVTSVGSSYGLTGGPITSSGSLSLDLTVFNQRTVLGATTGSNINATYNNGTSGVGATLTNAGTQLAFSVDAIDFSTGGRVLIKDQTLAYENGVYNVTTLGNSFTNWVLTRASDFDGSISGSIPTTNSQAVSVFVQEGNINKNSNWSALGPITTIGTSNWLFSTYLGSTAITTLGFIQSGTWEADIIGIEYGGTGSNLYSASAGQPSGIWLGGNSLNPVPLVQNTFFYVGSNIDNGPSWITTATTLQRNSSFVSSSASGTTTFPINNTTPQNTYGNQFMSVTVPSSGTNTVIVIDVLAFVSNTAGSNIGMAIFQDSNPNAIASAISNNVSQANYLIPLQLKTKLTGSNASTTFYVRIGSPGSGTITTFNESGASQFFNGTMNSYIIASVCTS